MPNERASFDKRLIAEQHGPQSQPSKRPLYASRYLLMRNLATIEIIGALQYWAAWPVRWQRWDI